MPADAGIFVYTAPKQAQLAATLKRHKDNKGQ